MQARGALSQTRPDPGPAATTPPATRPVRRRWRDPRLVVGVVVVAVSALVGARLLSGADDTVTVWASGHALQPGQPVSSSDLTRREVHFASQAEADRYVSADDRLPADATASRPVGAGELLPRAALGGDERGPLTEVPLSVGTEAVPSTVRVGSVVDVWVTPDAAVAEGADGARTPRSTLVLDDVPVVAVPRSGTSLGPSATRQVIVGVSADQEGALPTALAAVARGSVTLTVQR